MMGSEHNIWLKRFAVFAAVNTLLLIGIGGLVTSKGAGMAVPDWPTSYGYNMFFLPFHLWKGGIFYEHSHRLFASWVGFLTVVLAVWLWVKDKRVWLRRLGFLAVGLVILQGVLGGLRVVWFKDYIGIFHAALAQGFLALLAAIALFCTRFWQRLGTSGISLHVRNWMVVAVAGIFLQLLLGAAMRHQHSGLAVPDFPLAYGQLYPPTDPEFLHRINQEHAEVTITPLQIHLHMAHRIGALSLLVLSAWVTFRIGRRVGGHAPGLRQGLLAWQGLIWVQAILGACTVWTGKAADIATLHVVVGAVVLVTSVILALVAHRLARPGVDGGPGLAPSTLFPTASAPVASRSRTLAGAVHSR
ncbi:MAG: COX15/CtaA family protein [Verrucomicrobiales bacterium]|nr:COX15/CtaA family protein [Verrucomicrobiales bacterium]